MMDVMTDALIAFFRALQADDEIWVANELVAAALAPERERITGDFDVDGDVITFGTPEEGFGRLTYRIVERGEYWHIARREVSPA